MNIIKVFVVMTLAIASTSWAEKQPFVAFEAFPLDIILAKDGTGVVNKVYCSGCDFNQVKIMPTTKVYINGAEVNILRARERAGKEAMVAFNPYTREVQTIRWNQ
jgi:hypothetical protein